MLVELGLVVVGEIVPGCGLVQKAAAAVLGKKDAARESWLLESIPDLYAKMNRCFEELENAEYKWTDEARQNLKELTTQTLVDFERVASSEKRTRMTNVLVNGVGKTDLAEHRFLESAVTALDAEHVALLRDEVTRPLTSWTTPRVDPRRGTVEGGLVQQLVSWQFIKAEEDDYEVTELGVRFLQHLQPPSSPEPIYEVWYETREFRSLYGGLVLVSGDIDEVVGFVLTQSQDVLLEIKIAGHTKTFTLDEFTEFHDTRFTELDES